MANKKDRLTMDVIEAHKAGMSYGNWKALHPHTDYEGAAPEPENEDEPKCVVCGGVLPKTKRMYCCDECCYIGNKNRSREYQRRRKAELKAEKEAVNNEL